jgi:nucleotide-binding universal stress UspA family protein
MTFPAAAASRFVVGVDGSEPSRAALAWAMRQASAQGAVVQPVIVWQRTFGYGQQEYWPADEAIAEAARTRLAANVAAAVGPKSALTIDPLVAEGDPAKVLCELSASADLLVVGSRGLGGFAGLILGSVSTKCAHHGRCAVAIVPARGSQPAGQA